MKGKNPVVLVLNCNLILFLALSTERGSETMSIPDPQNLFPKSIPHWKESRLLRENADTGSGNKVKCKMSLQHLVPESKSSDHKLRGTSQKDVEKRASTGKIWNPLSIKTNDGNSIIIGWIEKKNLQVYSDTKNGRRGEACWLITIEWMIKLVLQPLM